MCSSFSRLAFKSNKILFRFLITKLECLLVFYFNIFASTNTAHVRSSCSVITLILTQYLFFVCYSSIQKYRKCYIFLINKSLYWSSSIALYILYSFAMTLIVFSICLLNLMAELKLIYLCLPHSDDLLPHDL